MVKIQSLKRPNWVNIVWYWCKMYLPYYQWYFLAFMYFCWWSVMIEFKLTIPIKFQICPIRVPRFSVVSLATTLAIRWTSAASPGTHFRPLSWPGTSTERRPIRFSWELILKCRTERDSRRQDWDSFSK